MSKPYIVDIIKHDEKFREIALNESIRKIKVLEKVKEILEIPCGSLINISQVAELYEMEETKICELLDVAEEAREEQNILISRGKVIHIAFLIHESEVAKELRSQLFNVLDAV